MYLVQFTTIQVVFNWTFLFLGHWLSKLHFRQMLQGKFSDTDYSTKNKLKFALWPNNKFFSIIPKICVWPPLFSDNILRIPQPKVVIMTHFYPWHVSRWSFWAFIDSNFHEQCQTKQFKFSQSITYFLQSTSFNILIHSINL